MKDINFSADDIQGFRFSCGNFYNGYSEVRIITENKTNMASITVNRSRRYGFGKISENISLKKAHEIYSELLNGLKLNEWKQSYVNRAILDGTQWSVGFKLNDDTEYSISGSNDYPKNWKKFTEYMNSLVSFAEITF